MSRIADKLRFTAPGPSMTFALALIVLFAVGLRMYGLNDVPVFYDEDRYAFVAFEMSEMSWGDAVRHPMDYLHTGVARSPLVLLAQALMFHVSGDIVLAGRVLSIASAAVTTLLSFWVGKRLGGNAVGLVTAILYAVSPLAILHEQMGLQDGPLAAITVAAVLASLVAVDRGSWLAAALAGMLGAVAVQCKPPGVALVLVPPMLVLLWPDPRRRIALAALAAAGPALSYAFVAFGPLGASMAEENRRIRLIEPLRTLPENLMTGGDTLLSYFTVGLLASMLWGRLIAGRSAPREAVAFSWVIVVYIVPWLVLSRFVPSRYFVPAIAFMCAFCAVALVRVPLWLASRWRSAGALGAVVSVLLVAQQATAGALRVLQPRTAPLSALDEGQYRSGWPAGFAYMDAARFVRSSVNPESDVAYFIDPGHRTGAGVLDPLPNGLRSLGVFDRSLPVPRAEARPLVVIDDSGPTPEPGVSELMKREPQLQLLARFEHPGSTFAVRILTNTPPR